MGPPFIVLYIVFLDCLQFCVYLKGHNWTCFFHWLKISASCMANRSCTIDSVIYIVYNTIMVVN